MLQHIDTATAYGNEQGIGKGLQKQFEKGSVKREDLFITSKLWNSDHAASAVHSALKASLSKLKLDYLDLYLIHWYVTADPTQFCQNQQLVKRYSNSVQILSTCKGY